MLFHLHKVQICILQKIQKKFLIYKYTIYNSLNFVISVTGSAIMDHHHYKHRSDTETHSEDSSSLGNEQVRMRFTRRRKQMLVRQTFYLVDSAYMRSCPNEFYIRSVHGDIFLIKYERYIT